MDLRDDRDMRFTEGRPDRSITMVSQKDSEAQGRTIYSGGNRDKGRLLRKESQEELTILSEDHPQGHGGGTASDREVLCAAGNQNFDISFSFLGTFFRTLTLLDDRKLAGVRVDTSVTAWCSSEWAIFFLPFRSLNAPW